MKAFPVGFILTFAVIMVVGGLATITDDGLPIFLIGLVFAATGEGLRRLLYRRQIGQRRAQRARQQAA